jgi:hypothetical protein
MGEVVPTDQEVLDAVREIKGTAPEMGQKKLAATIKQRHPDWVLGIKRVKTALGLLAGAAPPPSACLAAGGGGEAAADFTAAEEPGGTRLELLDGEPCTQPALPAQAPLPISPRALPHSLCRLLCLQRRGSTSPS